MKNVICIKWGTRYGPHYVNRLYAMLERHLSPPFALTCITDEMEGIRPEVANIPLPPMGCDWPTGTFGVWGKSRLWSQALGDLDGPVLFADLDLVILGDMDPFFTHGSPDDVVLARNPNTPFERLGQTSLYRFPVGKLASLREMFLADPQGVADEYRFEQRFVSRNAPGGVSFWPSAWVDVFKWHCVPTWPLNYLRRPEPRRGAKVVIFPGPLDPPDAIKGQWSGRIPHTSARKHLRNGFAGRRHESLWKHTRHYILPAPWVEEAWCE